MTFNSSSSEVQAAATQQTNEAVQAALTTQAVPAVGSRQAVNPATATFNTLGEFQQKYPELYNAFITSWAMQVCNDAKQANERLIQTMKEAERQR